MTDVASNLRLRKKDESQKEKGTDLEPDIDSGSDPEYRPRESTLTVLRRTSPHIRSVYHIFIAILIVLLLDTLLYDLIEHGKINVGITNIVYGFGDVRRCVKLWLFEFGLTLLVYPGLIIYANGAKLLKHQKGALNAWRWAGGAVLAAMLMLLLGVPVWALGTEHLAIASSTIVTLEMARFTMKICSLLTACAPRCVDEKSAPLPSFRHYIYFLFAPTLLYRDKYPRTKRIRWGVVAYHFMEVVAIIFYNSFLWERFILPYWSDYGKEAKVEVGQVVRAMFACMLPGLISFLSGFYCLLHAWLNAFAEMLTFADRLFYEDWWTSSHHSRYYRTWNRVVYSWLRHYLYLPLMPCAGRGVATLAVFAVSSAVHELVLALSFGFFYPVLLVEFGVLGLLNLFLTAAIARRYPNALNLYLWYSFIIGNGILWSLYPMEYFARKNCPPAAGDSYFVPKSWSCPEMVMKPNWTFHSPHIY